MVTWCYITSVLIIAWSAVTTTAEAADVIDAANDVSSMNFDDGGDWVQTSTVRTTEDITWLDGSSIREYADYDEEPVPSHERRLAINHATGHLEFHHHNHKHMHVMTTSHMDDEVDWLLNNSSSTTTYEKRSLQGPPEQQQGVKFGVLYTDDGYDRENGKNPYVSFWGI